MNIEQGMPNIEVLYRSRSTGACAAWRPVFFCPINGEPSLRNSCDRYSSPLRGLLEPNHSAGGCSKYQNNILELLQQTIKSCNDFITVRTNCYSCCHKYVPFDVICRSSFGILFWQILSSAPSFLTPSCFYSISTPVMFRANEIFPHQVTSS
jgi:hypothetical protein